MSAGFFQIKIEWFGRNNTDWLTVSANYYLLGHSMVLSSMIRHWAKARVVLSGIRELKLTAIDLHVHPNSQSFMIRHWAKAPMQLTLLYMRICYLHRAALAPNADKVYHFM